MTSIITSSGTANWDKNLIAKYDIRGPRYTSYPAATEFTPAFGEADYLRCLSEIGQNPRQPLSLYLHIPFCQDICYYCACNKIVTRDKGQADIYLTYLEKEMALAGQQVGNRHPITQLHWGGGSPTFLNAGQMTRLVHSLASHFELIDDDSREYSIEIDPRTVSTDTLALLKGLGFNRISLGVQDFSPDVQKAINRINSVAMVEDLVIAARDYGFKSINFDLIYGLPRQTPDSLRHTITSVIALLPERIAFYNYAHLPERFTSQRAIDRQTLPTASEKLDMLDLISEMLTAAGYVYIGMDHFVRPEDELAQAQQEGHLQRNFQGYSTRHGNNLLGLGMSAISSGEHFFSQNQKTIEAYYAALDKNHLPVERGLITNEDDSRRRAVIMGLIGNLHLNIRDWEDAFGLTFSEYFSAELERLRPLEQDGLLMVSPGEITITNIGRAMIRNICMIFDRYHKPESGQYSKTL